MFEKDFALLPASPPRGRVLPGMSLLAAIPPAFWLFLPFGLVLLVMLLAITRGKYWVLFAGVRLPRFQVLFPVVWLLGLVGYVLWYIRPVIIARRLFQRGLLTTGQVVAVRPVPQRDRSRTVADVVVSYQLPDGVWTEGTAWCANDWLIRQLSPGTTVHIAFVPAKPQRVALLEMFMR